MSKFRLEPENARTSIEKWSYFLKHGEELEEENLPSPLATVQIRKAAKEKAMFTRTEIERERYESRRKAVMDQKALLEDRYLQGHTKGRNEGREETKEAIARKLLEKSIPCEEIAEITGLSPDEVRKIARE